MVFAILCDIFFHFVNDFRVPSLVCFTEDMQLCGFHSSVAKDSSILGCDAVSLAQWHSVISQKVSVFR